jgi:hypothetical protein
MREENKLNIRHCSYCGKQMRTWPHPANECFMFYGDQSTIPIASKFDKKTGKQNFVRRFECHNYKKRKWYRIGGSPHDSDFEEKVFNLN